MAKYSKGQGHHCWWLKVNGKAVAHFDNEQDVDEIIAMESEVAVLTAKNKKLVNLATRQQSTLLGVYQEFISGDPMHNKLQRLENTADLYEHNIERLEHKNSPE